MHAKHTQQKQQTHKKQLSVKDECAQNIVNDKPGWDCLCLGRTENLSNNIIKNIDIYNIYIYIYIYIPESFKNDVRRPSKNTDI